MRNLKEKLTWIFLLGISLSGFYSCKQTPSGPKLGVTPIQQVIAAMSLEDKAKLVVGRGMNFVIPDSILKKLPGGKLPGISPDSSDEGFGPAVGNTKDLVPGAAGTTYEIEKLGITPLVLADGPAGLRIQPTRDKDSLTYYCTAFPVGTTLASTWDTALVAQVGQSMGNEVHEYGADVLLAPAINIHRNPLCGRNFEYYSEDPLLAGKIAASMIKGIQSQGVGTSLKHFAANNQETNRNTVNTIVTERALREIYLEGFRIAVQEAQPWTVMTSYNKINGTYTSERPDLVTTVLRDEWGFKGMVMTDWGGGSDPVAQMKAGNDLLEPGNGKQVKAIVKAVKEGKLDEKILDKNVERILTTVLKSPRYNKYQFTNKPDLKKHAAITRQAATEGMVLLKNDKEALPLSGNIKKVAVFGNTAIEIIKGGTGSGDVNVAYTVSLVEGLKNAGYTVDESLVKIYSDFIKISRAKAPQPKNPLEMLMGGKPHVDEMPVDAKIASKYAADNDVALIILGRNAGEGRDRDINGDFNLTDNEKSVVRNISQAFQSKGKKAIVILNIGGVIEVASWRNIPDAILLAWQPGQEAGNSIADVLSGKVNPSGKLTSSFPLKYTDVPSAKNFPGKELPDTSKVKQENIFFGGKPSEVVYEDDIYVGYRYYNTFNVPVAYEFGYGLSYTQFEYSNLKLSSADFKDKLTVTIDIKNTGKVAGKEVVQLYLSAPAQNLNKPEEELKGFAKTKLLNPGEVQTISFTLTARELASYDTQTSSWVAEAGNYTVKAGASSKAIKQTASFKLGADLTVLKLNKVLTPDRDIKTLGAKKK